MNVDDRTCQVSINTMPQFPFQYFKRDIEWLNGATILVLWCDQERMNGMGRDRTLPRHYFLHVVQVAQYGILLNDCHHSGDKLAYHLRCNKGNLKYRQTECFEIHDVRTADQNPSWFFFTFQMLRLSISWHGKLRETTCKIIQRTYLLGYLRKISLMTTIASCTT